MKNSHPPLFLLSAALLLTTSALAQSANSPDSQSMGPQGSISMAPRGAREAMHMARLDAVLTKTLSAQSTMQGNLIEATVAQTAHMADGTELPKGTKLYGNVVDDDMQVEGTSKLALRFNKAMLKSGQSIPIKATIVGIAGPEYTSQNGNPVEPGQQAPNSWSDGTLQVDQINVTHDVDLHSKIASKNSGVFVSKTKHNVTLRAGSELEMAVAVRKPGSTNAM